jgi:UDP-N-acetylglucosamine 2-epimerase
MQQAGNPFGDGTASHKIIEQLANALMVETTRRHNASEASICG